MVAQRVVTNGAGDVSKKYPRKRSDGQSESDVIELTMPSVYNNNNIQQPTLPTTQLSVCMRTLDNPTFVHSREIPSNSNSNRSNEMGCLQWYQITQPALFAALPLRFAARYISTCSSPASG